MNLWIPRAEGTGELNILEKKEKERFYVLLSRSILKISSPQLLLLHAALQGEKPNKTCNFRGS